MNRSHILMAVAFATVLSLAGLVMSTSPGRTSAQDESMQGHVLVGTWIIDSELDTDTNVPETMVLTADGSLIDVQGSETALGVWAATGPNTATITFTEYFGDDNDTFMGGYTVRANVEIAADGMSFTAEYTLELLNPDGTTTGQAGPGQVTATRMMVESPGTPVTTMDELFGSFGGTPEASPVS